MHIEGFRSARNSVGTDVDVIHPQPLERYKEEIKSLHMEIERLKTKSTNAPNSVGAAYSESMHTEEKVFQVDEEKTVISRSVNAMKMGLGTIQILADALPKIVPYVLINHRELLPLIMCVIDRHPECSTRDSLTHTLFNLIKCLDEQQRRIIMDACVTLAKIVGELRTEMESTVLGTKFVQPEIRDSLILSHVQ